jgi:predicted nuclease of predicted toxin-antitoxin system
VSVRLLFDQNLSRRLVTRLEDVFPGSTHVVAVELDTATDRQVWDYAGEHDLMIVSKDSDFSQLSLLLGAPPKVVWVRIGNGPTGAVERVLRDAVGEIEAFSEDEMESILVLPAMPFAGS